MKHARHHHVRYPVSMSERLYSIVLGPLVIFAVVSALVLFFRLAPAAAGEVSWQTVLSATLATAGRLAVAYVLAVAVAVPLAIFGTRSPALEAFLLPVFDIFESIPILALFPVVALLFIRFGYFDAAAVFIIFLSMLWNIVFTLVGGLKLIPRDIIDAAHVFGIRGASYVWRVLVPGIVPQLVTGSILAVAQGWNIIIVAEVLHTYLPGGTEAQDLFGVGSMLVHAAAGGHNGAFLAAVFAMIVTIGTLNFFLWQKLLHYSQRFRFE